MCVYEMDVITANGIMPNVSQLGEVAEIEVQMFGLALHFNRCTDVQYTTKTAILPNCCQAYVAVNLAETFNFETMITGKDLIEMGYKPNKLFKEAIEYANANNLSGDALREYMDSIQPVYIEPHKEPLNFHKNIRPENP